MVGGDGEPTTGPGKIFGKENLDLQPQTFSHCPHSRLIGPAVQGWDSKERNAIANITDRHFRDSICRAG
jgi:hypothetical protein